MLAKRDVKLVIFLILWYFIPLAYLFFFKKIILPFTILTILIFFFSLIIGMSFFKDQKIVSNNKKISLLYIKYFLYAIVSLQVFTLFRLIYSGNFNILNHRTLVFSDPDYLFGSSYVFTLYHNFLIPLVLLISIFLISFASLNKKLFNMALIILFFDAIIMLGRFQLFFIIFLVAIYRLVNKKSNLKLYLYFFLFLIFSQIIVFFRQFFNDSSLDSSYSFITIEYLEKSILSYQYYGYLIFETYASKTPLWGNITSLNLLNFPIYICSIVLSKFNIFINNPWEGININLSEGIYISSIDEYTNAFSTNFLPIYLDFGILGVLLFGLISGMIFGISGESRLLLLSKYLLFFLLFFGLYQPLILSLNGFVLLILVFLLISKMAKKA